LDSAVLEVLAGTESALGPTQIARLAGRGSRPGHVRVLERLAEHGLVLAEPTNKGHMYRLNRDHVLAQPLLQATNARREALDRLTAAVRGLEPPPLHVSVFGSFARHEGTERSDIDLLIVTADEADGSDEQWQEQMRELEDRVLSWTGNRLEVLVLSRDHLRAVAEAGEPILDSLRSQALTLHGPDISNLLAQGAGR
jgi:predicted nucleotidyltransferase